MQFTTHETICNIFATKGIATYVVAGVTVHLDKHQEAFYIEVELDHDRSALKEADQIVDELGFEIMPEWECPAEHLPNGALRHWMAEKEVVDDISFVEAV